jgi:transposase
VRVAKTAKSAAENKAGTELRGSVLSVLRELLAGGHDEAALAVVAKLVERNEELEKLLALARVAKNRGEHISKDQLDLFLGKLREQAQGELAAADRSLQAAAEENGGRAEKTRPPKQPAVRRPIPASLPRIENMILVPAAERPCPICGKERHCVGHEATPVIELEPAKVFLRLDVREVLACHDCDAEMVRAPMGDKVIAGGAYGSRLVAEMVIDKYRDGLPLHRIGQRLKRLGLDMPSSSMADQITWATELLLPIWNGLLAAILSAKIMHVDGTGLSALDRESVAGIVLGQLWGYVGMNADAALAAYIYTSTGKKNGQRDGELGPEDFLAKRKGRVVADAAGIFDASFKSGERTEGGCNMHSRRRFVKALDAGDARAAVAIQAYQALYDVEDAVRGATVEGRLAERQRRSKPVYDELVAWCKEYQPHEPPNSLLGQAIKYQLNHKAALTRFLDDGEMPIDNGVVERLHRVPAITRRNFLFVGSHNGGHRAAVAYSILASCEMADVNPAEYLADVLPKLARGIVVARDVPAMLPAAWKAARTAAAAK